MPLQITGHAVNLPDGTVEVLACGAPDALQKLEDWLREGPPMAQVTNVEAQDVHCDFPARFSIG